MPDRQPVIRPVQWLKARDVLGGEASHFTPWLQQAPSLTILGDALGLDDLKAIEPESYVYGKRLDILASAVDTNGEEIPVCIENQYGVTDGGHLGRLVAYLAKHERGRGVWVVESAEDAFIAAVRFLNRTSTDDAGYYLVAVKFTQGPGGEYQVYFDVLASPLDWERTPTVRPVNAARQAYLRSVHELVQAPLRERGFEDIRIPGSGGIVRADWPRAFWLRQYGERINIRTDATSATVAFFISAFGTPQANDAAGAVLHDRYAAAIDHLLPAGSVVHWDDPAKVRKRVRITRHGAGHAQGEVGQTAQWAIEVCRAVMSAMSADPVDDLDDEVAERIPDSLADDELDDDGL